MVRQLSTNAETTIRPSPSIFTPPKIRSRSEEYPPAIPQHKDFYTRTNSFKTWPKLPGVKVSDLVNSGFSYTYHKDRVQCFQCGKIIERWRDGDNVDAEHLRVSPSCPFILAKLGKLDTQSQPTSGPVEYVMTTTGSKQGAQNYEAPAPARVVQPVPQMDFRYCVDVPAGMQHAPKNLHPVAPRDIRARLDTPSSRKLLEVGFKKPLLAQVIGERLAETGDDFPTFMEYFIAAKNAEQILSAGQLDTLKSFYDKSTERLSNPAAALAPKEEEKTAEAAAAAPEPSVNSSASEGPSESNSGDSSQKRKKECNICMDAESDTVFMPCRHMCACSSCADKLANCPICRKPIEHCIKVYV